MLGCPDNHLVPGADMPKLVRLYIINIAIGFLLAVIFTALLVGLDIGNLRDLVTTVSGGWLAVLMLVVFHTVLFAGVQFAIAVMRMAEPDDTPRGGLRQHIFSPAPARVRVDSRQNGQQQRRQSEQS